MSITNTLLISDALRDINVISEVATPTAEQGSHALRKLNQMMAQWEVDGVKIGYFEQTSTTDTCPIPDWAEKGVTASLAVDLAPIYGATISVELNKKLEDGMATINRTCHNLKLQGIDNTHLGFGGVFDITTGTVV